MRRPSFHLSWILSGLLLVTAAGVAQEGHPLTGTWGGDWGTGAQRTHVTIVMAWDGKTVTGTLNPGPDAIQLGTVILDPTDWTVRIEADGKDQAGKAVHISVEGKIEDLSSAHRKLVGTWMQGTTKGDFRLVRD